jgi:membrane protease YdiL (CAAX protease family)
VSAWSGRGDLIRRRGQGPRFAFAHLGVTDTPNAFLFILVAVFPLGLVGGYLMRRSDGVVAPALFHAGVDIPIYLTFLTFVS